MIVGDVHQDVQVAAGLDAHPVEHGDQRLDRRVARARAHARERSVDADRARLDAGDRIGDAQREIVMGVDADFGLRLQRLAERLHPLGVLRRQKRARRIRHIDAFGAVALHQLRLLDQLLRRRHMRHHQKADRVHAELARRLDMLLRDVGLGAMGGDAHAARAPS